MRYKYKIDCVTYYMDGTRYRDQVDQTESDLIITGNKISSRSLGSENYYKLLGNVCVLSDKIKKTKETK